MIVTGWLAHFKITDHCSNTDSVSPSCESHPGRLLTDAENVVLLLTLEKAETMSFEGKWPQLESIISREVSQTQKVKY